MHNIADYITRLKTVSLQELFYRLRRRFRAKSVEKALVKGEPVITIPEIDPAGLKKIRLPEIRKSADRTARALQEDIQAKIDEFEGKNNRIFFSRIKISEKDPDLRSVWEPARLQQAMEGLFSEQPDSNTDLKDIQTTVVQWIKKNPFLFGVHYLSPMECGLRVPVFLYLLNCGKIWDAGDEKTLLSALYQHSWWVSGNLALYSSLGNHTICECVGLVFGGAVFAETGEEKDWLKKGCSLLDQELGHQILKDGGPAEQSLSYHRFVLDLYWLALDFLEKNRLHDCSSWKPALNKGELFLKSFGVDDGLFPAIGDSDDGYAVGPGLSPKKQVCDPGEDAAPTGLSFKTFPDSGYTVIRHGSDLFMSFDHGPLGMAPLYNHGHADALSFTLYIKKKPFFIDPGTFRYNGVPEHRAYFKGTRAHNTVCVDNMDQARQVTGFIWDKPYRADLISSREDESGIWVKARHEGYSRLKSPVVHIRDIHVSRQDFCLVTDSFIGKGCHTFESHLHLDPGVTVDLMRDWLVLTNGEVRVFLHNPDNGGFSVVQGRESPLLGWFSPAYGVLEKTITLQSVKTGLAGETGFSALICFNELRLETALEFKKETAGRL